VKGAREVTRLSSVLTRAAAVVAVGALSLVTTGVPAHAAAPEGPQWRDLDRRLQTVVDAAAAAGVTMSVTVKDLSGSARGAVAQVGTDVPVKAASIIKLPLLALLMERVDSGTLRLDTMVNVPAGSSNIVGGSGTLRNRAFPLDISIRELMELMVQVSDNTATNVLIDIAGGFSAVNSYISRLGFDTLYLGRKMIHPAVPPLQENYVNADEVTELLVELWEGDILSRSSSDHIIALMAGQLVNTKYGAVIPRQHLANKTGELADVSHDSGFVLVPGREVALATTTTFTSVTRAVADRFVQQSATVVYDMLKAPVPAVSGVTALVTGYDAAGVISRKTAASLLYSLERAATEADRGGEARTILYLEQFVARVRSQVKGDAHDVAARDALVAAAQTLLTWFQQFEDYENELGKRR
jgi:beta-lactamase class A